MTSFGLSIRWAARFYLLADSFCFARKETFCGAHGASTAVVSLPRVGKHGGVLRCSDLNDGPFRVDTRSPIVSMALRLPMVPSLASIPTLLHDVPQASLPERYRSCHVSFRRGWDTSAS